MGFISAVKYKLGSDDILKREDLISSIQNDNELADEVINNIAELRLIVKGKKLDKTGEKRAVAVLKSAKLPADLNKSLETIHRLIDKLRTINKSAIDLTNRLYPDYIAKDGLTVKQAGVFEIIDLSHGTLYIMKDLIAVLPYLLLDENGYYNKKIDNLVKDLKDSANGIQYLVKLKVIQLLKDIENLSDSPISSENLGRNDKINVLPKENFNYNPIYWIGRQILKLRLKWYEYNKTQAELARLKIAELRAKSNGDDIPTNIQEQIAFYEERLKVLEKRIREFEED